MFRNFTEILSIIFILLISLVVIIILILVVTNVMSFFVKVFILDFLILKDCHPGNHIILFV